MVETKTVPIADVTESAISDRTRCNNTFTPPVNIYETADEMILTADMPGIRPEDVELRYERGEVLLRGRMLVRERNGDLLYQEYEEGNACRAFAIPESIDSSKIEATCKNGVLTVRLPKVAAAQPKQIVVRGLETRSGGKMQP